MNISPQMIYWITRCDGINTTLIVIALVSLVLLVLSLLTGAMEEFSEYWWRTVFKKVSIPAAIGVAVFSIAAVFTPSTKEMAMIYGIPVVLNSERVQNLSSETINVAELGLKTLQEKIKSLNKNQ